MSDEPKLDAHVVVAKVPDAGESAVGSVLYAVITATPEEALEAVRDQLPVGQAAEVTGGVLAPETAERLALQPGQAKQIG